MKGIVAPSFNKSLLHLVGSSLLEYRSEEQHVLILCTCELDKNWSLFLVTNKSTGYIYIGTELEGYLSP